MKINYSLLLLAGTIGISAIVPLESQASSNNVEYRRNVVGVMGIMQVSVNMEQSVTRGEFANMLVKASSLADYLPTASQIPVYADVSKDHQYAAAIRICAEEDWLSGYLGGLFKPDQPITLQEATKGIMALLGYTNEDFGMNISSGRMAKFYALELNEGLNRNENEILNRNDCVNLFYNLLSTETKTGTKAYVVELGGEVSADGEVNPMALADETLQGPIHIPSDRMVGDYVPFNIQEASIYIDGNPTTYDSLKAVIASDDIVIYYNVAAKTVWAYTADSDSEETGRVMVKGTVENIYYSSANVLTPTGVILSNDSSIEYELNDSQMQFAFSIYGSLRVGDQVILVCEKTVSANGDATYQVIDYVEY